MQADAAPFIERLESGYATITGPGRSLVSGGQRQRLALAQALIQDPEILVLEEATASVDSATEKRIQEAVERAAKGRTVISIAHSLSTIRNADNIVVMDAGRSSGRARMPRSWLFPGVSDTDTETKTFAVEAGLDTKRSIGFIVGRISPIIRPSLLVFVLAIVAAVIVGATFSSAGVIIGHVVGALNTCAHTASYIVSRGSFLAGMISLLASVELFANFFAWELFGLLAERLLYATCVLSFRSLMKQGLSWHQEMTSTMLLSVITKDTAAIGGFSGSTMSTVLSILVNFVIAIVLSHIIAWKVAIVSLATVSILLGSGIMQLKMLGKCIERQTGAFDEATALAVETVHSIRTVAALSLEHQTLDSFSRLLNGPQQLIIKTSAYTNIWLAMHHSLGQFIYCLSYWWGTKLITRGEITQT